MKTNIRIACSRTQRWWFSGVVLFAAALSVACGHQNPTQEGSVEKSSTAMQVQSGDRIDETLDWNEHLIDALFSAGTTPPPALRAAAIMNVAMFDAANGVYRRFHPIHFDEVAPHGTSRRAAVIGAAYTTLSKLFPTQQSKFDADEAASLAALTDDEDDDGSGQSTSLGLAWGATVANDILAWRATDGFTTAYPPFTGGTAVGQWRPTPGGPLPFAPMVQQQFSFMKTFAVASAQQFAAPKPRGMNTDEWVSDYNEVAWIASQTDSPLTADQTAIAWFYAGVGWAHWRTLVNDQRAPTGEHVPLRDGDLIEIGRTFFIFRGTARGISDSSLEPIPGEADPPTLRPEWELELAKAARLSRTARLVPVSVSLHEVTLFELDGGEDVSHRRHGEDQVRDSHRRRRPEGDDETEIDGMADVPIEGGSPEPKRPVRLALQIHEHLPQAEEIEMVDEEGADQHDAKAHQGESLQRDADLRRLEVPHDSTDGLPVPEEQDQRQAGEEHVRAALDGWRNDLRPHLLEALPRHHAVLDGEHREQDGIDDERLAQRSGGRRIDGPWHEQVIDESDRVEERAEENQVAH